MGHRILVTGATGDIGGQVLPGLRERYGVTAVDVRHSEPMEDDGTAVQAVDVLAEPDRLAELMSGHDTVVHLANRSLPGPLAHDEDQGSRLHDLYEIERSNLDMAETVYRLAFETDVRRVVIASSNQAAKWYEQPYYAGRRQHVGPDEYPKPVSFYGWAKVAYESLGFLYASGSLGRRLEVVALRIVVPRRVRLEDFVGQSTARYFRDVAGYISRRDLLQLTRRSIDVPDIRDEDGVPFLIAYGTSGNARRFWDISSARVVLGYEPEDDAEIEFAAEIRAVLDGGATTVSDAMVRAAAEHAPRTPSS